MSLLAAIFPHRGPSQANVVTFETGLQYLLAAPG